MPGAFLLEIATPDRLLVSEQVTQAQIPALGGYIGVLPEHAPLLSALGTGVLEYSLGGHRRSIAISGGFVEVLPDHVRVLADHAENADEIDVQRAQESLKRAAERLSQAGGEVDIARALNAVKRAQARLSAAGK
ncbi:MAG: F0F1 ATP synthase subunit epsilon [Bryobacteraceae bacterium]|nr:F0F1 ATP synthase subunit epsilon [Bryobacteraceae bacterium]